MATVTRTGGAASGGDALSYTLAGVAIGADAPEQHLLVAIAGPGGGGSISNVTFDGVAAAQIGTTVVEEGGTGVLGLFLLPRSSLPNPAVVSISVSFTFGAVAARAFAEAFVAVDINATPLDFASDTDPAAPGTPTLNVPCDCAAGGVGVGMALGGGPGGVATITWSGTEVAQQVQTTVENSTIRGALISNGTAENNRAIQVNWTSVFRPMALFATFAPADAPVTSSKRRAEPLIWSPAGPTVLTDAAPKQFVPTASGNLGGVARVVGGAADATFTLGSSTVINTQVIPILAGQDLFIAYGPGDTHIFASAADVRITPGIART